MSATQLVSKITREQLFAALAASDLGHLVHMETYEELLPVRVSSVEREDGSGYLFIVEGVVAPTNERIHAFINTKPDAKSFGCIKFQ